MDKVNQRNFSVDVFRFIGALSVVALHVPYEDLPNGLVLGIRWWGRWAVPFFFLLSGYFFQSNYATRGEVQFVKTIKSLLSIYIISNAVYLLGAMLEQKKPFAQLLDFYTLDNGISEHLWFISSMLFGYITILYLLGKCSDAVLIVGSVALYIVITLADAYSGFFHTQFSYDFIRYFISIPFLPWGFMLSKKIGFMRYMPLLLAWIIFPLSFILQALEIIYIYRKSGYSPHNQEFVLLTSVFALSIFVLSLKIKLRHDTTISKLGRKYSLLIYLYHPIINIVLFKFIDFKSLGGGYLMLFNPIISFVSCLAVFVLIDKFYPTITRVLSGG